MCEKPTVQALTLREVRPLCRATTAATSASTANIATTNLGSGSECSLGDPWYPRLSQIRGCQEARPTAQPMAAGSAEPQTCKLQPDMSVLLMVPKLYCYV